MLKSERAFAARARFAAAVVSPAAGCVALPVCASWPCGSAATYAVPPELRDVARADGAVAVPVRVRVVAELAERRADGALGEGGVGLVDPAVAVDVLGGQVPRLAVGVVCDAEGEGAGAADGGDALVNQRAACSVTSSIIHRAKVQHASSSLGRTRVATRPGRRASRA
jgi:hypothetical protein